MKQPAFHSLIVLGCALSILSLGSTVHGQSRMTITRDSAFSANGAKLRAAYKHSVAISFLDTLAQCLLPTLVPQSCARGTESERMTHEAVRAALAKGFGATVKAASFEEILKLRAENARVARQMGGASAKCGGSLDSPLATVFTIAGMRTTDSVTVTSLYAHDFTRLAGCPTGITVFELVEILRSEGRLDVQLREVQHLQGRPDGVLSRGR